MTKMIHPVARDRRQIWIADPLATSSDVGRWSSVMAATPKAQSVLVKRYARSRLYEQLREWFANGIAFTVVDSETGRDITRVLLA